MGKNGYKDITKKIIETRDIIINGVKEIKELKILGDPKGSVVAIAWY
jgi:glutamate/tyrosine decarboxylase-like PLP-dependent enzyme